MKDKVAKVGTLVIYKRLMDKIQLSTDIQLRFPSAVDLLFTDLLVILDGTIGDTDK